ncbi:hypothetical protein CCP3SC1AL1_320006 [Gammaproteobacteria bacterium]
MEPEYDNDEGKENVPGKAKKSEFKNIDDMSIEEYVEKMRNQGYGI